jgi:hypothetical protein
MDRDEYMGRNEWLVQFIFTLMVLLVVGIIVNFAANSLFQPTVPEAVATLLSIIPNPFTPLGMMMGFIWAMLAFFAIGMMKPKKRRPVKF